MPTLGDISERLFIRSQEAVLQLNLWIRRQQHLSDIEHEESANKLSNQYDLYMAQLNSLCVRSEYVRDKLNGGYKKRTPPIINEKIYIEDLVYEFQDITAKLNELAHEQKEQLTPSSKCSNGSVDSFQPRPLKLTERHRSYIGATRQSPLKAGDRPKNVNFAKGSLLELPCPSKCTSLPGSPLKIKSPERPLRVAKSYDTGLNPNLRVKLKKKKEEEMLSVFKENQRLSITFCEANDDESDSASDQNTVISTSPAPHSPLFDIENDKPPLRRCNSHDSVLSTKAHLASTKRPAFLTMPTANRPSMKSVTVSSAPVISSTGGRASSKDLLSLFVNNTQTYNKDNDKRKHNTDNNNNRNKNENFNGSLATNLLRNIFRPQNQNEYNRNPVHSSQRDVTSNDEMNQLQARNYPRGIYTSCSRLVVKSHRSNIISPTRQPIKNGNSMYDELQEALNTELIL